MPVLKFNPTDNESAWAVWRITETEHELKDAAREQCPAELASPTKRLEFLAARVLVRSICHHFNLGYVGIAKEPSGKPYLPNHRHFISLTHSFPYVAAQLDVAQPVGVDLEQPKEKLTRVASRVLNQHELQHANNHLTTLCVYWCAKESLYKIQGARGLSFQSHLAVDEFTLQPQGLLTGHILTDAQVHASLRYFVEPDYVLVITEKIHSH
jgi:phosphopantetheinyl transferase